MFKMFLTTLLLMVFTFADGSVLKTGQTKSYDQAGIVVTDGSVKDDGYYQAGAMRGYSRNAAGVVEDTATRLEWQDDYSDNGGNIKTSNWQGALDYCSALGLDSGGWRLPAIKELQTIVDASQYDSCVTPGVFSYIEPEGYRSSTTTTYETSEMWGVSFLNGNIFNYAKSHPAGYVRCVRGTQLTQSLSRNNVTEIVTDSVTGLQWQDDSEAASMVGNWKAMIDYCENTLMLGGHDDWRLPNQNELLSIVDYTTSDPAMDTSESGFQNTDSLNYWSSSTSTNNTTSARHVYFSGGYSNDNDKTNDGYVRCVRDGQFDNSASLPSIIMYLLN